MTKICHLITGLNMGGAEKILTDLVTNMDPGQFENVVVSLTSRGPMAELIEQAGVPVHALGMGRGGKGISPLVDLTKLLKSEGTDVLQTWLYHSDLAGLFAGRLAAVPVTVWGIHNYISKPSLRHRMLILLSAMTSSRTSAIVACSEAAAAWHIDQGYSSQRMRVIHNGIDTSRFKPDKVGRLAFRKELGVPDDIPLIGMVARFHPQKDHRTFIQAADHLHRSHPSAQFVLCGGGVTKENLKLVRWLRATEVADRFHLLGCVSPDAYRVINALDVSTVCSLDESFSLTLVEAMACEVPCVATRLPGPSSVMGGRGWMVPPQDPVALADAWREVLNLTETERRDRVGAARDRVSEHFSLGRMVRDYQDLYLELTT